MFCAKEFNSELYKEIEKEEISTQASVEENKEEIDNDEEIAEKL